MQQMHQATVQGIPKQQTAVLTELNLLQQQIKAAGIGGNPQAEDRYLQLLEDATYLDQSWDLGQQSKPKESMPEALQKTITYGRMLFSVYQGGALVKGAGQDIEAIGRKLASSEYHEAQSLGRQLLELCSI